MDALDGLTRRLGEQLNRQAENPGNACVDVTVLGQRLAGSLIPSARDRVDAHLDECLICLNTAIELRDHLHGIAAPAPVSVALRLTLDELLGDAPPERAWTRVVGNLRRALAFRIPAWAVAGAVATILMTWAAVDRLQGPAGPSEPSARLDQQLTPAHSQAAGTISGVVRSISDATSNGVDAHVVRITTTSGVTYVLFAWGQPTVRAGESVEVDAVFTGAGRSSRVYQGVATAFRRAR